MRRVQIQNSPKDQMEAALEAELVKRDRIELTADFRQFVEAAWPHIEAFKFKSGIHVDAICAHLQACAEHRITSLVINIAPRHSKSTLVTVLFSAWVLARNPKDKLLHASYSQVLATRDGVKCRSLVESDWFQARWPEVTIRDDSNLKTAFVTTQGGGRQTTSVGGTVTGLGGNFLILDDPLNAKDGDSATVREAANQWFSESWYNRVEGDPDKAVRIVVMQRLHSEDISARCQRLGYEVLTLPARFEGERQTTSIGWTDPRTEPGELLWPEQWSKSSVDALEKNMGAYGFASQYQQRPVPRGGGVIQRSWLRFWYDPSVCPSPTPQTFVGEDGDHHLLPQVPLNLDTLRKQAAIASWDLAFKGGPNTDFVVGQVYTKSEGDFVMLDQFRDRVDFVSTKTAMLSMNSKWTPQATLVEEKANGAAILAELRKDILGLIAVTPQGDKHSRLSAVAPLYQAGNVLIPHPDMAPWVLDFVAELTMFPRAPNDDQVDSMSQALVFMRERNAVIADTGPSEGADGGEYSELEQVSYWLQ